MRTIQLSVLTCLTLSSNWLLGQGLVNFYNTSTTLISAGVSGSSSVIGNTPGSYYFGLLLSQSGAAGTFSFSGLYATNGSTAGMFTGGSGVSIPGVAAGARFYYEIAGWSANAGHDWNPDWQVGMGFPQYPTNSYFGVSSAGTGVAGGSAGTGVTPPFDLFGGSSGLQSGFTLFLTTVPEPSTTSLLILGGGLFFVRARRRTR